MTIWLLAVANLLYLVSYAVRGIIALRALTIVAGTCVIPYFLMRPDPLMGPVYWNLVFIGLNAWCLARHARLRGQGTASGLRTLPRSAVIRLQAERGSGGPTPGAPAVSTGSAPGGRARPAARQGGR